MHIQKVSWRWKFAAGMVVMLVLQFAVFNNSTVAQEGAENTEPTDTSIELPADTAEEITEPPVETAPETTPAEEELTEENNSESAEPTAEPTVVEEEPVTTPELSTDKDDYHPGETATIFGHLFESLKTYTLRILGFSTFNGNSSDEDAVTADEAGSFTYFYTLDDVFRPEYIVQALDSLGQIITETTFTDAAGASVNIEQCANGPIAGPFNICKKLSGNDGYTSGNVTSSKAHYFEGQFIPYRAVIEAPNAGPQQVTFGFDTAKDSDNKHAIDYLGSFNETETTGAATATNANQNDPCSDVVAGCNPSAPNATATIPVPTTLTTAYPSAACGGIGGTFSGSPDTGVLSAWVSGGTISGLTVAITGPDTGTTDCQATMKIDFNLSAGASVVFAWGGHIAANANPGAGGFWGPGNAVPSGSPYHMRTGGNQYSGAIPPTCGTTVKKNECEFGVGNQDLQLAGAAIIAPQNGHIIVDKVTNPSGDAQSFSFDASGGSYTDFSLTDAAAPNDQTLIAGNYSVAETVPSGWDLTSSTCVSSIQDNETPANLELDAGETITCTFTNTKKGHIIVDKVTDPSGDPQSFSFDASGGSYIDFSLTDAAAPNNQELVPGSYGVTETVPAGWTQSNLTCDSSLDDIEIAANLELDAGETITCTFTNTKNATVIVKKVMVGGTSSFDFTGTPNGSIATNNGTIQASVAPGQYVSTETVPAGWDLTGVSCDDQNSVGSTQNNNATFNAEAGETVTCTFTNTKRATIIVDKLTNPSGDSQSFDFITTGTGYSGFSLTDTDDPNSQSVTPGTYTVNETVPAGWSLVDARCVLNNNPAQPYTPGANIVLAAGDTVTCFFNNVKLGKIIVEKQTDPDGDSQVFDFNLSYGDNDADLADGETDDSGFTLIPGTYSVSETPVAGWDLESATCDDGSDPASIGLQAGETVTCTFTNEKDAFIIVDKVTDPVGDPQIFNFTASYDNDGFSLTDASTPNNSGDLDPGTYAVSETVPAGWDQTSATCDNNDDPSAITLAAGETVTCTFTNQKDAFIIVDKVTNPSGNATQFDFTSNYGSGFSLADATTPNNSGDLDPGAYSVSEAAETGWDLTSATCDGQGNTPAAINLAAGQTVTCTFTNTQRGAVIIDKNSIGGDDTFAFTGTGSGISANFNITTSGTVGTESFLDIEPGTKTITESAPPPGWDFTNIVCQDPTTNSSVNLVTQTATLDVAPGETVRCRFINTKRGHIIVDKVTNPSGDSQSFNFTTSGVGYVGFSLTDAALPNDQEVKPGAYTVSETVPSGWDQTSATCDNDEAINSIDVEPGETITCIFTNTKRGHIIVNKVTDPAGDPQSFDFDASGGSYADFSLTDTDAPNDQELVPGSYAVAETVPSGWDQTSATCDNNDDPSDITLGAGETVTCTFTNTKRGHLIVQKTTDPSGDTTVFTISASGNGTITGGGAGTVTDATDHDYEVTPGTYSVAETVPVGWDKTGDTCQNVVVAAGQTATCLLTNVKRGTITIVKNADPNDCQNFAFTMTGQPGFSLDDDANVVECLDTDQSQSATFNNLAVNTNYTVTEALPNPFWEFGGVTCVVTGTQTPYTNVASVANGVTITLNAGSDVTCTFLNNKLSPTRTQGFWQTHTAFTSSKFATHFPGGMPIGTAPHKGLITNTQSAGQSQLFGAFFSNIAQKTTGKGKAAQRTDLDKARMQLLQQLVAAKLNCASFGCTAAVQTTINNANTAYAGNSVSAILAAAAAMDAYNNSGDTIIIGNAGSATPQTSKLWADLTFWDAP